MTKENKEEYKSIIKECFEDNWGGDHEVGLKESIFNINFAFETFPDLVTWDPCPTNDGQLELEKDNKVIRIGKYGMVWCRL